MRKQILLIITFLILTLNLATPIHLQMNKTTSTIAPRQTMEAETWSPHDVYEYGQNESQLYSNAHNESSYNFESDRLPSSYYGYRLHANITNLRKTVNPLPNGNFEQYSEPGNNWSLAQSDELISTVSTSPDGNPGSCLDIGLVNTKVPQTRSAFVDNDFEYNSTSTSNTLILSFDIRYSTGITTADWLIVRVEIQDSFGDPMGMWWKTTADFNPTSWSHVSFPTMSVNGSLRLRITLRKTATDNLNVSGQVYFDNFEYQIGSSVYPTDVALSLNNSAVVDAFGYSGSVDIYTDPFYREELPRSLGWITNQSFIFTANESITFDVQYTMFVKTESLDSAIASFSISSASEPSWIINYTIPAGRPPPGYENYQFGLYLPNDWNLKAVRDQIGNNIISYSYNITSRFLLMNKKIGSPGDSFNILCVSVVQTEAVLNSPIPNGHYGWQSLFVNASWMNLEFNSFVKNAIVMLRYNDESNNTFTRQMESNDYGSYSVDVQIITIESNSPLSIEIEFYKEGYLNATTAAGTALEFTVVVNTGLPSAIYGVPTEFLILAVLLCIIIILSWLLYSKVYKPRYVIPKQVAHARKLQEVLEIFNDVTNLSRFLVLHHGSGIAIFDPFKDRGMDASLLGGFLQALQAFAIDVAKNSDDSALPSEARLSEITYEGFRVIIHDGTYTRTALVYRGTPSNTLKEKIQTFSARFEEQFSQQLKKRGFEPAIFDGASDLLEEIFHVSLLFPHKLVSEVPKGLSLSVLENRLHFVALELAKSSEFVFLGEIMNSYLETVKEEPTELMNAIFELREKKLLIPTEVF